MTHPSLQQVGPGRLAGSLECNEELSPKQSAGWSMCRGEGSVGRCNRTVRFCGESRRPRGISAHLAACREPCSSRGSAAGGCNGESSGVGVRTGTRCHCHISFGASEVAKAQQPLMVNSSKVEETVVSEDWKQQVNQPIHCLPSIFSVLIGQPMRAHRLLSVLKSEAL